MAVLEMLAEVIGAIELLGLVALAELVSLAEMFGTDIPVSRVGELFAAVTAHVGGGGMDG
jgi:hypothetical protein